MKRRMFTVCTASVIALTPLGGALKAGAAPQKAKPDVVIIYADDLGYGDLACMGLDPSLKNKTVINSYDTIEQDAQQGRAEMNA